MTKQELKFMDKVQKVLNYSRTSEDECNVALLAAIICDIFNYMKASL